MKRLVRILTMIMLTASIARANLVVPGADGSDGALLVTSSTTINLAAAVTGTWNSSNAANAGAGIYDPTQWAVVYKYSNVTINLGATVTFNNHASRAPVVWLVNGNVTISGTLNLTGAVGPTPPALAEPGPGGFRGGPGYFSANVGAAAGFGVGGGDLNSSNTWGAGGSYGSLGSIEGISTLTYGNPSIIPLIGGAGGSGCGGNAYYGGGAGGGAILIVASGTISVNGTIWANGGSGWGNGYNSWNAQSGGGSGGAVRLVAGTLAGNGVVQALGGAANGCNAGGLGMIEIERVTNTGSLQVNPDPSVVPLTDGTTPVVWPPSTGPQVQILTVGGLTAPADPRAAFGATGADVVLSATSTTQVVVQTTNVEQASTVQVRYASRANGGATWVSGTVSQIVSTTPSVINWTANVPVRPGYGTLQVKVVRP